METTDEEITDVGVTKLASSILEFEEDETTVKAKKFPQIHATSPILKGFLQAIPVIIGYLPVATAYGILAQDIGLSLFATVLMSFIVYAGSSQFIAIGMIATGQTVLSIVLTTFIVNLRHLLFSTSITPHLSKWTAWKRILFATELTDEMFALHSTRYQEHEPNFTQDISSNMILHLNWILGSALGFTLGSVLGDIKVFGLDYALPALFIALLIMFLKNKWMVFVSIITIAITIFLIIYGFKTWAIILAASTGATLGMIIELWKPQQSS